MKQPRKVLLLDDEEHTLRAVQELLAREGFSVTACLSAEDALEVQSEPDMVVTDWHLGMGMDGADVARRLKARWPRIDVIVVTAYPTAPIRRKLRDIDLAAALPKPLDFNALLDVMTSRLDSNRESATIFDKRRDPSERDT